MNEPPVTTNESPSPYQKAIDKYKELYAYSTDVLLKEHDRFNRADEKASKYATTFVFLIGAIAFFDKAAMDEMIPPHGIIEWLLVLFSMSGLIVALWGWYGASSVIRLHPYVSRRLDSEMVSFFRKETLLDIYYGLARENTDAYEENLKYAAKKYDLLIKIDSRLKLAVGNLVLVAVLFGLRRYLMAC
jgi:hypothetical protein